MNKHLEIIALRVNEYLKQGGDIAKASAALGINYNSVKTSVNSEWGQALLAIFNKYLSSVNVITVEKRKKIYSRMAYEAPMSLETDFDIKKASTAMKAIDYLNKMEGIGNEAANKEATWIERVKESVEASREVAHERRMIRLQKNAGSHPSA